MKKVILISLVLCLCCIVLLTSCDSIYPMGNLKVKNVGTLSPGESVEIEITYPDEGGAIVWGWKDQCLEIISGEDVISVSGLTITALKQGTAEIKVSATTVISEISAEQGHEEKEYSTEITVKVK